MADVALGTLLWEPPSDARTTTRMGRFITEVERSRGLELPTYEAAWRWSVDDLDAFWAEVARWFDVTFHGPPSSVLSSRDLPGARWYPGATLNYAEHALRRRDDEPAIVARSQTRDEVVVSFAELADQVARAAAGLRRLGVERGDRVVGYLPNVPETIVAFLACASIGAIWSSCAPEFGTRAVIDRVQQIEPKVLLVVDGYRYGTKEVDRTTEVAEIRAALPTLEATVLLPYLRAGDSASAEAAARAGVPGATTWAELLAEPAELTFDAVPFDHPLYVLYSSGTTGLPKAIVHGHGGILLEHLKMLGLHHDLGPGDRFCWFTTTGWMMWNYLVSGLTVGATVVLVDGDPGYPDLLALWRIAAELQVTLLGVGAPFLLGCRKAGLSPRSELDLSRLRSIGSTGAPLPPEGFGWVYEHVGDDLLLTSASGGTDLCTAFVAGAPLLPVHAGEIAGRCLGAKVEAYDPTGRPVIGQLGELVLSAPMPSMPVSFWGDPDGSRYRAAYFEDFPGVWRHGDWIEITERGSCIITGRSDATLNRGGVRMGTAEFYSAVEGLDEVADALVVHLHDPDDEAGRLVLFVQLAVGVAFDDALRGAIARTIRAELSPRHVPDELHAVSAIPRTISGKKLELPIKRLLEGEPLERVVNPGAVADPSSLEVFVDLAAAGVW
ncbi:MAG: acetoacetate--CoA ligase [Nitriliruptoraceae bacterium]